MFGETVIEEDRVFVGRRLLKSVAEDERVVEGKDDVADMIVADIGNVRTQSINPFLSQSKKSTRFASHDLIFLNSQGLSFRLFLLCKKEVVRGN